MVSCPPSPKMQSGPDVPVIVLLFDVPSRRCGSAGQHEVLVPSTAVTFWVTEQAVFPAASRAVQVTVVVPSGNTLGLLLVMVTAPQGSVAVAVPMFTLVQVGIVNAGGTNVNVGAVRSGAGAEPEHLSTASIIPSPSESDGFMVIVPWK